LVCVRCRYNNTKKIATTAEIIIDKQAYYQSSNRIINNNLKKADISVLIKDAYKDMEARNIVKSAGGKLNHEKHA